jgi:hypothetical protein
MSRYKRITKARETDRRKDNRNEREKQQGTD